MDWYLHDGAVARWLDAFLRQWIAGAGRRCRAMRVRMHRTAARLTGESHPWTADEASAVRGMKPRIR